MHCEDVTATIATTFRPGGLEMPESSITSLLDDPRALIGATAIGGGQPAGEDIRDDPAFEAVEAEFRKMETAGPGSVDWKMLNGKTLDLISGRSKDLVLASRLAYGLHREEGYKGLAVGLSILKGMVLEHWQGLFPPLKRERGRAGSFDWLAEKLAPSVETQPPTDGDAAFALVSHDMLVELDEALAERLEKFPVALGPLIRALRPYARDARAALDTADAPMDPDPAATADAPDTAGKEAPVENVSPPAAEPAAIVENEAAAIPRQDAPQVEAAPARPATPAVAAPAVVIARAPDIALNEGVDKALQSLFNAAAKVATGVRQQAPSDPRAYLCARFAIWGQVRTAPPDSAGKTALPPPQKAKLGEIEALQAAGNSQGLIMAAESAFVSSPFWLDAQRIAAQAMEASGSAYDGARAAVVGQLCAFLTRMPGLTGLSFSDGMPFASGETLGWIDSQTPGGGDAQGIRGTASGIDALKTEAEKLGRSGNVLDGLKLMADHAESCFGERARFLAQLEIGEYCLRFDVLQPLFSLLDTLRRTAERRALDRWEPDLALALASLCWRSVTHKAASRFHDERASLEQKARIMATMADLDIVAAARLNSDRSG